MGFPYPRYSLVEKYTHRIAIDFDSTVKRLRPVAGAQATEVETATAGAGGNAAEAATEPLDVEEEIAEKNNAELHILPQ